MKLAPGRVFAPRLKGRLRSLAMAAALGTSAFAAIAATPVITVVDPSPVNWLSITWNTMEELVRVDKDGRTVPTLAESYRWVNDTTMEFKLRKGVAFQDGEPFNAKMFRRSFDEVQKSENPHPPGAFLNFAKDTKLEVVDDYTVRFVFPSTDSAAVMKFSGMHVASTKFWNTNGFKNKKSGNAEGNW